MIARHAMATAWLALAAAAAAAAGSPPPHAGVRTLQLSAVQERAVCPIEVQVDEDLARSPPRIKLLRCARAPLARCLAGGVPRAHCCAWRTARHVASCVEIIDHVAVSYRAEDGSRRAEAYPVPVGCACVPLPTTDATED